MLRRVDVRELAFGLFLIVLASVAFVSTRSLSVGTAADMGPGFVPRALAWIILGFGACVLRRQPAQGAGALARGGMAAAGRHPGVDRAVRRAVLHLGLIVACVGAVLVAGTATRPVPWGQLLLFGPVLAALSALLFVKGLGLPFKVWPSFLARQYWPQLGAW